MESTWSSPGALTVMSFNCIREPHFVASPKSHDFVGFHLDQAQPAHCSSLSWAHVVKYQPANDSASGVSWMPDKGSVGDWLGGGSLCPPSKPCSKFPDAPR